VRPPRRTSRSTFSRRATSAALRLLFSTFETLFSSSAYQSCGWFSKAWSDHPAWSTDLLHRPHATVTAQGHSWQVRARELAAHEKEQQRDRILPAIPFYDTYAARAGREIRVFCLAPITAPPAGRPAQP
jgi:hypothetical protein